MNGSTGGKSPAVKQVPPQVLSVAGGDTIGRQAFDRMLTLARRPALGDSPLRSIGKSHA